MGQVSREQIEALVQRRDAIEAKRGIVSYLRRHRGSFDVVVDALEWYRRLGLFRDGYLLASRHIRVHDVFDGAARDGVIALWIARYLYLLGATQLAVSIIVRTDFTRVRDSRSLQFAAEVYQVTSKFDKSISLYLRSMAEEKHPKTRDARISRLGLADSLAGAGRLEEALVLVRDELKEPMDDTARSVVLSCEGEFLVRLGRIEDGRKVLDEADRLLPAHDRTVDRAVLAKWRGYTAIQLGNSAQAAQYLELAVDTFEELKIRQEAIFDVWLLQNQLTPLPQDTLARIAHFPGVSDGIRKKLASTPPLNVVAPNGSLLIDLRSGEFRQKGQWRYGLTAEAQVIAWLAIAGDWALPRLRLLSMLWADEPFGLPRLEKRFDQLLHRLRHHFGLEVLVSNAGLCLAPGSRTEVSVIAGAPALPSLLRELQNPQVGDVMRHYSIKKTAAYRLLKQWQGSGLIGN